MIAALSLAPGLVSGCGTTAPDRTSVLTPITGHGLPAARAAMERGDIAGAIAEAQRHTKAQPKDPIGHYTLGTLLSKTGDWPAAKTAFEECLALNARHGPAHNNLGLVKLRLRLFAEAAGSFRQAARVMTTDPGPLVNLAAALSARGDYQTAVETYEEAVMRAPQSPELRLGLATAMARAHQRAEAMEEYRRLLEDKAAGERFGAEIALGMSTVLRQLAKYDEAIKHADRAVALAPKNPHTLLAAALVRDYKGDHSGAEAHYKRALSAAENNLDVMYNFAVFLEERGRKADAMQMFERYVGLCKEQSARCGHVRGRLKRLAAPPKQTAP